MIHIMIMEMINNNNNNNNNNNGVFLVIAESRRICNQPLGGE